LLFACILPLWRAFLGPPELRGGQYIAMFYELFFSRIVMVFFEANCYLCVDDGLKATMARPPAPYCHFNLSISGADAGPHVLTP
jgi:hypothetical protein